MGGHVTLLDGGMGQELIARASTPPTPLWSADVMLAEPQLVADVYIDFINAGARAITLNTYSATRPRLARQGKEDLFEDLQRRAVEIAQQVANDTDEAVDIIGSLSPLVSSYEPFNTLPFEECYAQYEEIVALQVDHVSAFLAETMCCIDEAVAATKAMAESDKPAWCALTVSDEDGHVLRSGEPVDEATKAVKEAGAHAILVNCSRPEAVNEALPLIAKAGLPFGAYANGFTSVQELKAGGTVDVLSSRQDLNPNAYAEFALSWARSGASIVGGCCEVGPAHIAQIQTQLNQAGYSVSGVH